MEKLTTRLKKGKRTYPMLGWIEMGNQSQIAIISSAEKIKPITSFPKGLNDLFKDLEEKIGINNLILQASEGDDTIHSFRINELQENQTVWDELLKDVDKQLSQIDVDMGFNSEISDELIRNQKLDIAASALKCIYGSILFNLITKALDLGITEMLIVGDIIYHEGLSVMIENNLPEHMTLSFLEL